MSTEPGRIDLWKMGTVMTLKERMDADGMFVINSTQGACIQSYLETCQKNGLAQ